MDCGLVICVGADSTGQMLKGTLRQQGIDTSRVCVREGARTGTSMILVDRNGERRIFSATGVEREIRMEDLAEVSLMISRASQTYWKSVAETRNLNIIGTYNLLFNASLLVESGACCALGFEKLINTTGDSPLCFRPLAGQKKTTGALIWKKYQTFSPAVQLFIDQIRSFNPQ